MKILLRYILILIIFFSVCEFFSYLFFPKFRENLIFYQKQGYKFFTQKRDPSLSQETMEKIFKEVFFKNINFTEQETIFLLDKMFINVTILHPIQKRELSCFGKVNDYELK